MTVKEQLIALDAKIDEHQREHREFWRRAERSADDVHVFNQQFLLRSDEIHRRQGAIFDRLIAEIHEEFRAARIDREHSREEAIAETRAHRAALFRILDELKGDDPPPAA